MITLTSPQNKFLNFSLQARDCANKVLHSKYFLAVCACLVVFFHTLNLTTVGFGIFLSIVLYCVITQKDLLPVVTIFGLMFFLLSTKFVGEIDNPKQVKIGNYLPFTVVFVTLTTSIAIAVLLRLIKRNKPLTKSKLFVPTVFFCLAILLSGVFSPYYSSSLNLAIIAILIVSYFGLLLFTNNCSDNLNTDYVFKLVLTIGLVVCIQLALYFLLNIKDINGIILERRVRLGWGWNNFAGLLIAMSIPSAFYLASKHDNFKKMLFVGLAFGMYLMLFLTLSRNSIAFGSLILAAMSIYLFVKSPTKVKWYLIVTGVVVALCLVILGLIFKTQTKILFDNLYSMGFDDSARFSWYKAAIDAFKQFPMFGVGWQYDTKEFANNQPFFAVHNSPLQYLASVGTIGAIAIAYFLIKRLSLLFKYNSPKKLYLIAIFFIIIGTGLLDLSVLNPIFIFVSTLLFAAIETEQKNIQILPNLPKISELEIERALQNTFDS